MQNTTKWVIELKELFETFKTSTPKNRQLMLPRIELACAQIQSFGVSSYVSQCLTRLLESCRKMARQRQPKDYDESTLISRALGDLDRIISNLDKP